MQRASPIAKGKPDGRDTGRVLVEVIGEPDFANFVELGKERFPIATNPVSIPLNLDMAKSGVLSQTITTTVHIDAPAHVVDVEATLRKHVSCTIPAGEVRKIENRRNDVCTMLVVIPYAPEA